MVFPLLRMAYIRPISKDTLLCLQPFCRRTPPLECTRIPLFIISASLAAQNNPQSSWIIQLLLMLLISSGDANCIRFFAYSGPALASLPEDSAGLLMQEQIGPSNGSASCSNEAYPQQTNIMSSYTTKIQQKNCPLYGDSLVLSCLSCL